jgi:hypothetical protein
VVGGGKEAEGKADRTTGVSSLSQLISGWETEDRRVRRERMLTTGVCLEGGEPCRRVVEKVRLCFLAVLG